MSRIVDSFIITGAYERTNPSDRIERRIQNAIHDCGVSILLTTLTTVSAFSLGTMSRVPAMKNFYIYAATCVFVDFIYQVSFFLALLYTNEKRKAEGRYDWLFCFKQKSTNSSSTNSADRDHDDEVLGSEFEAVLSRTDRKLHKTLRWYCNQIEQCTIVRVAIISGERKLIVQ
jgi:predicted RND superfamily exporter protein